jgi:hypothetical protein
LCHSTIERNIAFRREIVIVRFRRDLYLGSEVFVGAGARDVRKVLDLQVPIQVGQFFDALVVEFLAFGHHEAGVREAVGTAEGLKSFQTDFDV